MKSLKKMCALLLALAMVVALNVTAFATGTATTGSITISNPQPGVTYTAYKIFDVTYDNSTQKNYSYTINSQTTTSGGMTTYGNPWFNVILKYMAITGSDSNPTTGVTATDGVFSGNGLTLTPTASNPNVYVVTGSSTTGSGDSAVTINLSAAGFANYLLSNITVSNVSNNTITASIGVTSLTGGATFAEESGSTTSPAPKKASNLSLGYYLVVGVTSTTTGEGDSETTNYATQALAELTTTDPDVTITDKNAWPQFDKKQTDTVTNGTPLGYDNTALDVQIGDTVYYQITDIVPDTTGYTKFDYIVTDTMTEGLTLKTNASGGPDVTIKVGNNQVYPVTSGTSPWTVSSIYGVYNNETLSTKKSDNTDYSSTDTDAYTVGFKISIDFVIATGYTQGDPITITYSATVNEKAVSGVETNTAVLTYSNDPKNTTSTATIPKETKVYDASIEVVKFDGETGEVDGDGNLVAKTGKTLKNLAGAEFVLYRWALNKDDVLSFTTATGAAVTAETEDAVKAYYKYTAPMDSQAALVSWTTTQTDATTLTTDENGKLKLTDTTDTSKVILSSFAGLEDGTYYLLETKAPDGYNLLPDAVAVAINSTESNGTRTWTATDGKTSSATTYTVTYANVNVNVANEAGSLLPSTGGMGTTIFYIVGAILVIGAGVILITRRRMNNEK